MGSELQVRPLPGWLPGWARRAWTEPGGPWRPPARDITIAGAVTVVAVLAAYGEAHPTNPSAYFTNGHHLPHTPTAALLLVVLGGVVLAWRNRYPRLVLCAATAATVAYSLPGYVNGTPILLPAIALVSIATRFPVRVSVAWALAVTLVVMAATGPSNPFGHYGGAFWIIPADNAVALFVGIAIANRSYVHLARLQAARQDALDAQRRVEEERLRIARELHDVVAHTMATITVQAAAASQLLRDRPDEAAAAVSAIRAASKDGLRELRVILDVLRSASCGSEENADPTQPAPGLARLDALVEGVTAAGLPVSVTVTGQPRDLPAITDLSAFRIIQEALTNTIRHAGPATAAVAVDYGADDLRVEITDTGRGLAYPGATAAYTAGHGLPGMRERATAAGGTVDIGPLPGGGFRVAARLPLGRAPVAEATATGAAATGAPATPDSPAPQKANR
jgi:signal transduction histidine kinase